MNFLRLLLWALIGWLLYITIKRLLNKPASQARKPTPPPVEHMVRCKVCGLHIPQKEALYTNNQPYCSDEHRRQDQSAS